MFTKIKHLLRFLTGEKPVREAKEESINGDTVGPEQTIELLLSENGGHLRQQEILAAVDWSPSTVSRRLSEMEEQGRIRRVREHREKYVWLPGQPPEWVQANYMSKSPGVRRANR